VWLAVWPEAWIVKGMDDDGGFPDDLFGPPPAHSRFDGELLTLALLEDLAGLLHQHGYPPLRGSALAELTAALARLQYPHGWPPPTRPSRSQRRSYRRYRGVRRG
jgi:hypothetical protein